MPTLESAGNTSIESNATENAAVFIKTNGKTSRIEYFAYAQSKDRTTSGLELNSGWVPISAETREGKTTLIIKMTEYPNPNGYTKDMDPTYQAIDYDPATGALLGVHQHNNGYKTREKIEEDFRSGRADTEIQLSYFHGASQEAEFLGRFDWIINPGSSNNGTSAMNTESPSIVAPSSYGKDSANIITNYNPKSDEPIQIDLSSFAGAVGKLKIAKKSEKVAQLAKKNIDFIYDRQQEYLYYNENGKQTGFGEGGIFAILEGKPKAGLGSFEFI
jgi:hypothetical protein